MEHKGPSSLIHFEIPHQAFMLNSLDMSSSSVKDCFRDVVGSNFSVLKKEVQSS